MALPAEAAKRKVPFGFFSAVLPPEMSNSTVEVSDAAVDQQFARMARSGVEAVRMTSDWERIEPAPGAYDFSTLNPDGRQCGALSDRQPGERNGHTPLGVDPPHES